MRLVSDDGLAVATIWQEARGEIYTGKVAVAEVIRNRVKAKYSCDGTVADCVMRPLQFSCWNNYSPSRAVALSLDDADPVVAECLQAWQESATSNLTDGANHYFNPKLVHPDWAAAAQKVTPIGNHYFVRMP